MDETISNLLLMLSAFFLVAGAVTTYLARRLDRALERIRDIERIRAIEHMALVKLAEELPPDAGRAVCQFVQVWRTR